VKGKDVSDETNTPWWAYENLPSGEPYDWGNDAARGDSPWDSLDFHLDLGCGKLPKGRLGIDRFYAPNVGLLIDMEHRLPIPGVQIEDPEEAAAASRVLQRTIELYEENLDHPAGLPFPDESIESIISHHFMEHVGDGFVFLMDECYRILKPGGVLRIIVPLFPSRTAVEDPDHRRNFMEGTFETFCGAQDGAHWHESFSVPYTKCRFEMVDKDFTARPENPADYWGPEDAREIRVALRKWS
jgi:SAM-dependent methyltransferase